MKRKGFTIVEIVISLVILTAIGLVVGVGMNKVFDSSSDGEASSFQDRIISSTDLYLANNQSLTNELQTHKGYLLIKVEALIDAGLLDENTIDPETGSKISGDTEVKVSLDANGLLKIEYNSEQAREPYLEGQTLNLEHNSTFNCSDINSYADEWGSQTLRLIDVDGLVMANPITDIITEVSCDIDTSNPGPKQITYTYKIPGVDSLKTYIRTGIVGSDPTDIVSISGVASPKTVIIKNPVSFTVTATDRTGNKRELDSNEFIVSSHSTSAVGSFSPIITYNLANSDGSKPKTTVTYTVVYDPNDIVSISGMAVPQKIILNGSVSFSVTGKNRTGAQSNLAASDYIVSGATTSNPGFINPLITYNRTNSDGSKPTTTAKYNVIDNFSQIITDDVKCTVQPDGSCIYIGEQSGNYVDYLGKVWRMFKKESTGSISLILNDTTGANYAYSHNADYYNCSPAVCCNSTNSFDSSTSQYMLSQNPNGLLSYLRSYVNGLSGNKNHINNYQYDISRYGTSDNSKMTSQVGLLSYSDYSKISSCSTFSCGSSYLRIGKEWGLANYYNTNRYHYTSYDISLRGFNRYKTPKYHETLYINSGGNVSYAGGSWRLSTTDGRNIASGSGSRLGVRPVINLKNNVTIKSGNGTIASPFKIV